MVDRILAIEGPRFDLALGLEVAGKVLKFESVRDI